MTLSQIKLYCAEVLQKIINSKMDVKPGEKPEDTAKYFKTLTEEIETAFGKLGEM